jgi:hypothetical protein
MINSQEKIQELVELFRAADSAVMDVYDSQTTTVEYKLDDKC